MKDSPKKDFPKVYPYTIEKAQENGETELYYESLEINRHCVADIDKSIEATRNGHNYNLKSALAEMTEKYGAERVYWLVAATIRQKNHDGRISDANKAWAQTYPVPNNSSYFLNTHPAVLDAFADYARQQDMIKDNPLKNAELSLEQNYNSIDGIPNNFPIVSDVEIATIEPSLTEIPTLRKFISDDIIGDLESIMKINTKHYQSDFEHDRQLIIQAAQSDRAEDKYLLWMSRPSGTYSFPEDSVFIKDITPYHTWNFYAEQTKNIILAYAVEISGIENGKVTGILHALDYEKHVEHVKKSSQPLGSVMIKYTDGTSIGVNVLNLQKMYDALWEQANGILRELADIRTK